MTVKARVSGEKCAVNDWLAVHTFPPYVGHDPIEWVADVTYKSSLLALQKTFYIHFYLLNLLTTNQTKFQKKN